MHIINYFQIQNADEKNQSHIDFIGMYAKWPVIFSRRSSHNDFEQYELLYSLNHQKGLKNLATIAMHFCFDTDIIDSISENNQVFKRINLILYTNKTINQ